MRSEILFKGPYDDFQCGECLGNPVMEFLERKGTSAISPTDLKSPGCSGVSSLEVKVISNEIYARVSNDHNPVHISPIFAKWAELPSTIRHRMYISAIDAGILEHLAMNGGRPRLRRFSPTFTDMV